MSAGRGGNAQYELKVYDTSWNLDFIITDFASCDYTESINEIDTMRLVLAARTLGAGEIQEGYKVSLRRRSQWGGSYTAFSGQVERIDLNASDGKTHYIYTIPSALAILQRPIIAWKAGTADRSEFSNANISDIIENLITYNTTFGTAALGRERSADLGVIINSTWASDGSGISINYGCAWRNLYDTVMALCAKAEYHLRVLPDATFARWNFLLGYTLPGSDKTAEVVLSRDNGAITEYFQIVDEIPGKTAAIVGGSDQGSSRNVEIVERSGYVAGTGNELFVDQRNASSTSELNAAGVARLESARQYNEYTLKFNQVPTFVHGGSVGDTFHLGDTIQIEEGDTRTSIKVLGSQHSYTNGAEKVSLRVRNV